MNEGNDYLMQDKEAVYVNMAKLLTMTAIDLMAAEADEARKIFDTSPPKLSKQQYLNFNRSMMDTVRFESEALVQRARRFDEGILPGL